MILNAIFLWINPHLIPRYSSLNIISDANLVITWSRNPHDMIQQRSNSDFDVKCATIQFYGNNHNSPSDRCIDLKFYVVSPDIFSYIGLKFQVNWSLERHRNMGQQRLYEFSYLLPFDLWTFYLAKILFLKRCGNLFWESPNSTKIFNELQHSFKCGKDS